MIEEAKPEDVWELKLRPEDAAEVSKGWQVRAAHAIRHHQALALRDEQGRLVALGGVVETQHELVPWLLCSDLLEHHKVTVWRAAKRVVSMLRGYAKLSYNHIPKASRGNRRFVEALGFRIIPSPVGDDLFYLPHV